MSNYLFLLERVGVDMGANRGKKSYRRPKWAAIFFT
jgi:hypothetical protein